MAMEKQYLLLTADLLFTLQSIPSPSPLLRPLSSPLSSSPPSFRNLLFPDRHRQTPNRSPWRSAYGTTSASVSSSTASSISLPSSRPQRSSRGRTSATSSPSTPMSPSASNSSRNLEPSPPLSLPPCLRLSGLQRLTSSIAPMRSIDSTLSMTLASLWRIKPQMAAVRIAPHLRSLHLDLRLTLLGTDPSASALGAVRSPRLSPSRTPLSPLPLLTLFSSTEHL